MHKKNYFTSTGKDKPENKADKADKKAYGGAPPLGGYSTTKKPAKKAK